MTRPLLVGSYLQVTRDGLSANEKEEKNAWSDNNCSLFNRDSC